MKEIFNIITLDFPKLAHFGNNLFLILYYLLLNFLFNYFNITILINQKLFC